MLHFRFGRLSHGMAVAVVAWTLACGWHSQAQAKETQEYVNDAQTDVKRGNLKAAEIELRNAARQAPQDAHVRAMLAEVYLMLGDFDSAIREAHAARDLKGEEADYLLTLAQAMLRQGKFADLAGEIQPGARAPELESKVRLALAMAALGLHDRLKAETLLREAITLDDKAPAPKLALARSLLGSNVDEAANIVDAILTADPRSAEAVAIKGEILMMRGDMDGATHHFDDALAIEPTNLTARLDRANLNLTRGNFKAVDDDLDPILSRSPKNFSANYLRALEDFKKRDFAAADKILDLISPAFSYMAEGLYVQAATKYSLRQYAQADAIISKYMARIPNNPFGVRLAAMIALQRGAPDVGVKYLTDFLAKSRPDPKTLALLGYMYVKLKKPALALEQYHKAAELAPDDPVIKTAVAASEIDNGDGRKGLAELERIFVTDAGETIAGPTIVLAEIRAGHADKAAQAAEKLTKRDSESQLYQVLLGLSRVAQKNYPEAEKIFLALLARDPSFAPATTNLAHVYVLAGQSEDAKKAYRNLLVLKPDSVTALLGLADIAIGEKQWDEATNYISQARKAAPDDPVPGLKLLNVYALRQDWERTKQLAAELSAQFSSNVGVLEAQGRVLLASGDRDGAIEAYRRAYTIAPDSAPIVARYLSLLAAAKKYSDERTVLLSQLDYDPANRRIKADLIRVEAEISGLEAGLASARSFAKDDPSSAVYDLVAVELYMKAEKPADAVALAEKAAAAYPLDDSVTIILSGAYGQIGNLAKAEAVLTARLQTNPDNATVRAALADFYLKNDKFELAIAEEIRLLTQRTDDPVVLNNLAWAYQQVGDLSKAREFAERAVALAPGSGPIEDTLGWVLLAQGDTEKALSRLQEATAAMPGNPDIQYHVAVALSRAGRPEDARAVLEQLLTSGAPFKGRNDAQKLLEKLKQG